MATMSKNDYKAKAEKLAAHNAKLEATLAANPKRAQFRDDNAKLKKANEELTEAYAKLSAEVVKLRENNEWLQTQVNDLSSRVPAENPK